MDKGGVLGIQPLIGRVVHRGSNICRKNLLSIFLIEKIAYLTDCQVFKGLDLRDTEHAFDESAAFFEIDNIVSVDFTKRGTSDSRESALDGL